MSGHKWSSLQTKRFKRTMRLKRRFNNKGAIPPSLIIYRGYAYRRTHSIEVIK